MTAVHVDESVPLRRLSVPEYFRLGELGFFGEDERVELLRGVIVEKSPPTPEHDDAIQWLMMHLVPIVTAAGLSLRVQSTIVFEELDSVPQPDLLILDRRARGRHPTTGHIAIEVSVSSLRIDTRLKAGIYAEAGIPEYWVVDVPGRRVLRHTDPRPQGYERIETLDEHALLRPHLPALPGIAVRDLLDGDL